ncbi:MAG: hypothetical protein K2Y14_00865 [Burkholderiales bacterium]|nr:hypothetical protein [Burkholderiales bacterium]
MFKLTKLTKLFFGVLLVGVLGACSPTPNNVTLTLTPSSCVTGAYPGYEATATSYSNGYSLNATMPATSPYCMAVTLTNNNSGTNANNIQVFQGGLQLTYNVAGVAYSGYMIDFNASGIPQSTYTYTPYQQLGNIALFDPSNCVTTIGSHVNTLNQGGGQCTFYLGVVGEAFPVGTYPLQLQINYTNGNDSYFVTAAFNQRVNLYAGGDFTAPGDYLAIYNGIGTNVAESTPVAFPGQAIQLLTRDAYGDIFAYDGLNTYVFNGGSSWTEIGLPSGVTQINALSSDTLGNIFAATDAGVWTYSLSSSTPAWSNVAGTSVTGSFAAVQSIPVSGSNNTLFATDNSWPNPALLACSWATGATCAWSSIFESANTFFNSQALAVESATLQYWASGSTVWQNNNGESSVMLNESTVDNQAGPIGIDPIGLMYVSFKNTIDPLVPSVFSNSIAADGTLTPLTSSSGQALLGAANGVAVQSISYNGSSLASVVAYGNNLFSADFSGVNSSSLAYVLLGYSTVTPVASSNWTPITGISGGAVNSVAFASVLTTY